MSSPLEWVEPLLAGELSDEQVVVLEQWLKADESNRLAFVQEVQLCRGIRRALLAAEGSKAIEDIHSDEHAEAWAEVVETALASRRRQEVEASAAQQLASDNASQRRLARPNSITPKSRHSMGIPIPLAVAGLAAALFFVFLLWPDPTSPPQGDTPPITRRSLPPSQPDANTLPNPRIPQVASLQGTNQPQWGVDSTAQQPDADGRMSLGLYRLESGDVNLQMDQGAVLLIEGPAEFELLDDNSARLVSGHMTASISASTEAAFQLETPSARFNVREALYGVQVGNAGETEAYVFSGEVAVMSLSNLGSIPPMQCRRRQGVVIESPTVEPQRSAVVPEQFALDLSALTGKPIASGDADYLRSMPETVIMNLGPQTSRAWIALESTDRLLQRGTASAQGYPERTRVFTSSRGRVDSYLVVFDPDDETNQYKTAEFEITFPGRVLTVITENDDLSESHGWYGDRATRYERFSTVVDGLEAEQDNGGTLEFRPDTIELSEDGRTMKVFLGVHNGADVFRVLIEHPDRVGSIDRGGALQPTHNFAFIRPDFRAFTSPQLVAATISLKGE